MTTKLWARYPVTQVKASQALVTRFETTVQALQLGPELIAADQPVQVGEQPFDIEVARAGLQRKTRTHCLDQSTIHSSRMGVGHHGRRPGQTGDFS